MLIMKMLTLFYPVTVRTRRTETEAARAVRMMSAARRWRHTDVPQRRQRLSSSRLHSAIDYFYSPQNGRGTI